MELKFNFKDKESLSLGDPDYVIIKFWGALYILTEDGKPVFNILFDQKHAWRYWPFIGFFFTVNFVLRIEGFDIIYHFFPYTYILTVDALHMGHNIPFIFTKYLQVAFDIFFIVSNFFNFVFQLLSVFSH